MNVIYTVNLFIEYHKNLHFHNTRQKDKIYTHHSQSTTYGIKGPNHFLITHYNKLPHEIINSKNNYTVGNKLKKELLSIIF